MIDDRRERVCGAADLDVGERTIVEVNGIEVGVFNVGGDYFAVQNTCPHRNGPVCEGKVSNALEGEWPGVGQRLEESLTGEPAIACPWHGWEFDLATGRHLGDASFSVPTFDVEVDGGALYVLY